MADWYAPQEIKDEARSGRFRQPEFAPTPEADDEYAAGEETSRLEPLVIRANAIKAITDTLPKGGTGS